MLSYSNFGTSDSPEARLVAEATKIVKRKNPELVVDGEMQASIALNNKLLKENYPFSELVDQEVNTLIFPNLAAGNVAYNLLKEVGGADAIGPILLGLKKPVHVLQLGSSVRSIVNMAMIAVIDAQIKNRDVMMGSLFRGGWWRSRQRRLRSHDRCERGVRAILIARSTADSDGSDHLAVHDDRQSAGHGKHW